MRKVTSQSKVALQIRSFPLQRPQCTLKLITSSEVSDKFWVDFHSIFNYFTLTGNQLDC